MSDLQQQLQALREHVARIDRKYAQRHARAAPLTPLRPPREIEAAPLELDQWFERGSQVETSRGCHFEAETHYAAHRRHGSADIGALSDLPHNLLAPLLAREEGESEGGIAVSPTEWAFLDTETTGSGANSGACAFLIGVGNIGPGGFRVRQFFMRGHAEEPSVLEALARHLSGFRVLITYNGRSFDQPLLEARYRLHRMRPPLARLHHVDLLHGARRLWKLRYESRRLVDLEQQVLGFERHNDVPGALIPYLYFEYQRTRLAARLIPVFHHNVLDIVSLACLTAIVPRAFEPDGADALRHGGELLGLARWRRQTGDLEQSRTLLRRAIDAGLSDELLFRSLWDLAQAERKLGDEAAALALWTDLSEARNPYRVAALEELAKYHEHRTRDTARALEYTRAALDLEASPSLLHRAQRLARKHRSTVPAG